MGEQLQTPTIVFIHILVAFLSYISNVCHAFSGVAMRFQHALVTPCNSRQLADGIDANLFIFALPQCDPVVVSTRSRVPWISTRTRARRQVPLPHGFLQDHGSNHLDSKADAGMLEASSVSATQLCMNNRQLRRCCMCCAWQDNDHLLACLACMHA